MKCLHAAAVLSTALLALITAACSGSPDMVMSPTSVQAVDADAKTRASSMTIAVYGGRGASEGQVGGYLRGAVVTVTTSAGVATEIAEGPLARARFAVQAGDSQVHVHITYPGFCDYDATITPEHRITLWLSEGCQS